MRAEETDMGTRDWGGVYGGLEKTEWEPQASKKASFPYIMCFRQVRAGTCRVREGWPVTIIPIRSMLLFSRSVVSDSVTPWTAACQASPYFTTSWSLHKFMSIESVMPSNHLILCHPLLLLPSIFPSIRSSPMSQFFASGGQSIGVSASASVLPMNIQGWLPLGLTDLILQFKSLLKHHSLKTSVLWPSVFFIVQLSHLHMTTGKTIALTTQTFVGKVISLIF